MRIYPARIARIWQATPTIKAFELEVDDPDYKYLPGQWVEVSAVIDGDIKTSGYSITTSPTQKGVVGLAIKTSSTHPVTRWLHAASVGDTIDITRGQGPFVFLPDMGEDIVLIGGGVGVTPLLSIFRFVRDASPETHATLYYSVSEPDEILFCEELEQAARRHNNLSLEITVTQPCAAWRGQTGRINKLKLAALNAAPDALFYLCGPPGMVDDMENYLRDLGVPPSRIIFEKWW
ncbi:MAG: FAD-dependent oxidoreductase [Pseudomonadota bacterium]